MNFLYEIKLCVFFWLPHLLGKLTVFNCTVNRKIQLNIFERIKSIREQQGISQKDVAQKIGITQQSYAQIEKGNVRNINKRLSSIASALNVSYEMLITQNESIIPEEILIPLINSTHSTQKKVIFSDANQYKQSLGACILNNQNNEVAILGEHPKNIIIIFSKEDLENFTNPRDIFLIHVNDVFSITKLRVQDETIFAISEVGLPPRKIKKNCILGKVINLKLTL